MHGSKLSITWEHVAAHSGILGNEEADRLATAAAKRLTYNDKDAERQPSITPSGPSDKQTIPNIKLKVIIIPKKNVNADGLSSLKQPQPKMQTTPNRKTITDKSEIPIPGCVNGSSFNSNDGGEIQTEPRETNAKCTSKLMDNEQTIKCITNVEVVLQTVMAEIHELRQHQLEFKRRGERTAYSLTNEAAVDGELN